ncbi:DSK1 [Candida theae]|uniref:non-specific serine/threonine protein kinase n=1 Tax=Candida theae TaxID=1198502 RepID=A0AAD5FXK9_9ASCO|nr:DSK1 [Candida theae]KAI5953793.1 DSK1 [Candida theae]
MLLINRMNSGSNTNQSSKDKTLPNNGHFRNNSSSSFNVTADGATTATPSSSIPSSSLPHLNSSPSFKRANTTTNNSVNNEDSNTDKKSKFTLQGMFRKKSIPATTTTTQKNEHNADSEENELQQPYTPFQSSPFREEPQYNTGIITTPIPESVASNSPTTVTPHGIMDNTNHITIIQSIEEEEDENEASSFNHISTDSIEDYFGQHQQQANFNSTPRFVPSSIEPISRATLFSPAQAHISHQGKVTAATTTGSDDERYTSFTADCVSLQNSEMSTAMELDSDTMIINAPDYKAVEDTKEPQVNVGKARGEGSFKSKLKETTTKRPSLSSRKPSSAPKRNLKSLLRIGSFSGNHNIRTTNPHKDAVATKVSTPAAETTTVATTPRTLEQQANQSEFSFDEGDDNVSYSESEFEESQSELNFDPKHEESESDYKLGGYHPVCKGDVYFSRKSPNREYVILRKLGWGHFSTVWLAKSRMSQLGNASNSIHSLSSTTSASSGGSCGDDCNEYFVAIKFVKSNKNYREAARDEIRILQTLQDPVHNHEHLAGEHANYFESHPPNQHPGYNHLMKLLDDFEITGPNGNHVCMVFEILGENVLNLIYKYKKFYRHVDEEIKRKSEEGDESKQEHPQSKSEQQSQTAMKFGKWDNKYFKRNTKSKLSLGLTKKDLADSTNAVPPSTASTISSTSTTVSPIETVMETSQDIDSSMTTTGTAATGFGLGMAIGAASAAGCGTAQQSTTVCTDPWQNSMERKLKAMSSESLVKLIKTSRSVGGIPLPITKTIVKQLLLAIDYMHHCGIIHTDLKPENILINIEDINKVIRAVEEERLTKAKASNSSLSRAASLIKRGGSFSKPNLAQRTSSFSLFQQAPPATVAEQPEDLEQQQQQPQPLSAEQKPRQDSTTSVTSSQSSSFYYKRSKNSISGKHDCPIRSSKPLSSATTSSDIFFKDVDFGKARREVGPKTASPKNFSLFDRGKKSIFSNSSPSLLKTCAAATATATATAATAVAASTTSNVTSDNISIKIADLGNATYTNEHFTNQIQTRQYRSPEIILKYKSWGSSTDLWSIGCIIFELITGDFLFDPHDGKYFDKDEDHLAQIVELLGRFPSDEYLVDCKLTGKFFKLHPENHRQIIFKNIDNLKYWGLEEVLVEKYKFSASDPQVKLICDLILKCLTFDLDQRYDAGSLLKHPWFSTGDGPVGEDDGVDGNAVGNETTGAVDEEALKKLPNVHDDLPGYTCEA